MEQKMSLKRVCHNAGVRTTERAGVAVRGLEVQVLDGVGQRAFAFTRLLLFTGSLLT